MTTKYQIDDSGVVRDATQDEVAEIEARIAGNSPIVLQEVTRRQGLRALFDVGVTEAMIEDKLNELLTGDDLVKALIDFRAASTFERFNPLVLILGDVFSLDLDALFSTAQQFI